MSWVGGLDEQIGDILFGVVMLVLVDSLVMAGTSARAEQTTNHLAYIEASVLVGVRQGAPEEMSWAVIDKQADDFWDKFSFAYIGIMVTV